MKRRKKPLTLQEIVNVTYNEWVRCVQAKDWSRSFIYDEHLKRLGYFTAFEAQTTSLQRSDEPIKNGLGERYLEAAFRLKWYDAGPRYGLTKRTTYLSTLLFSVAWDIQAGNSVALTVWLDEQIAWEKEHGMPAYKMLVHIKAHLQRENGE